MSKNHYEILGLQRNASQEDIKKKYRILASIHHPDKPNGNKLIFSQISISFNILKDPIKRKNYDLNLTHNERIEEKKREEERESKTKKNTEENNEFFINKIKEKNAVNFFNNYKNKEKEKPIYYMQKLTIKESKIGCNKKIEYERIIICNLCNGIGYGKYNKNTVECPNCLGTGQKIKKEKILLEIQPNNIVGDFLLLEGMGNETKENKKENGDLIIQITWNGTWNSKKKDLYTEIQITEKDIYKGVINFKNFDGTKMKIKIPENIKNGQTIKLKGKGWPESNSDLYIKIKIKIGFLDKIKMKLNTL